MAEITIQNVVFHDSHVEVTYVEEYDKGDAVVIVRTIMISQDVIRKQDLEEILDAIAELVDAAIVSKRNPSKQRARVVSDLDE